MTELISPLEIKRGAKTWTTMGPNVGEDGVREGVLLFISYEEISTMIE